MNLVIVESPAKAKTIGKILGNNYKIKASIGHVRDLPEKGLGIDEKNNFKPQYVIIPGKEKIIRELKKETKEANKVFLATDPDREGEAIAFHIAHEIKTGNSGKKEVPIYRVAFHEITAKAVKEAINNPTDIDINKVNAQQARRILDRLVGYKLSPFLWKKIRRGLSAGRVQSVALRLIVEREREIEAFIPQEYWSVEGLFATVIDDKTFKSELHKYKGNLIIDRDAEQDKRFFIKNEATATEICNELSRCGYVLKNVEKKIRKRSPSAPFITSSLQQEAAVKLKFTAKKTMQIAQQLYEGLDLGEEGSVGLITYMRTDSFRVSPEAQKWARRYIVQKYGKEYIPEALPIYKSKSSAQDAHEAIRPTYPDKEPDMVKRYLTKDQYNLYKLIWNRFIASQMAPALFDQTTFVITPDAEELKDTEFRATGSILRFPGFLAVYGEPTNDAEEDDNMSNLPDIMEGSALTLQDLQKIQHFTQPPPRYSEATLVKTLEEKGIGRPSTYATILSTIQDRKYTTKEDGRFKPTELGMIVNDVLVDKFPTLMDYQFTANMEEELDDIENAKLDWIKVVRDFYEPFSVTLKQAENNNERLKPEDIPTDETCEKCGKPMVIRWGRHGRFYACSGFPDCKNTRPLETEQQETLTTEETCEKCGSPMVVKNGRYGKFLACSNYPDCKNAKPITTGLKCPIDNGDIIQRNTKKGRVFWSCSNYPDCNFATWDRPIGEQCPQCGSSTLFEKTTKGGGKIKYCHKKECNYKEAL
ncbi:MAG: type I DNA topoisomerase [Thermodesulfovibrionales bacterium]|nr:type I DNA topoisomerase [Thermodesulfovibrionales bacterium]